MDQADLARKAVVSRNVISDFEKGSRTPLANNLAAIKLLLEGAGVEFTNGEQPACDFGSEATNYRRGQRPALNGWGAGILSAGHPGERRGAATRVANNVRRALRVSNNLQIRLSPHAR
jgi:transcriptional regulator with XRE-family HTH domain